MTPPALCVQHLDDTKQGDGQGEGRVSEAAAQVAFADLLLLNKVDLVSPEDLEDVKQAIRNINKAARLIECQLAGGEGGRQSMPALDHLLGVNTFSVSRALEVSCEPGPAWGRALARGWARGLGG